MISVGMKWNGILLEMLKAELLTQKRSFVLGKK